MKIVVTGGEGQLGRCLVQRAAGTDVHLVALARPALDITQDENVAKTLDAHAPAVVVNAAAYTNVDRAESDKDRAYLVNAFAAGTLARQCQRRDIRLLHLSTDYVFDGTQSHPYRENEPTRPLNIYGASKSAGEQLVLDAGGVVVRTSWLFSRSGGFVQRIVEQAAVSPVVRVVADQTGCPTSAEDLADALLSLASRRNLDGVYHYCGAPATTWHGFATAIVEELRRHRAIRCESVEAISSAELARPARRPGYSVLDTARIASLGIRPPSWADGLRRAVARLLNL